MCLQFFLVHLMGNALLKAAEESEGSADDPYDQAQLEANFRRVSEKRRRLDQPWRPLRRRTFTYGPVWNRKQPESKAVTGASTSCCNLTLTQSVTETRWPYNRCPDAQDMRHLLGMRINSSTDSISSKFSFLLSAPEDIDESPAAEDIDESPTSPTLDMMPGPPTPLHRRQTAVTLQGDDVVAISQSELGGPAVDWTQRGLDSCLTFRGHRKRRACPPTPGGTVTVERVPKRHVHFASDADSLRRVTLLAGVTPSDGGMRGLWVAVDKRRLSHIVFGTSYRKITLSDRIMYEGYIPPPPRGRQMESAAGLGAGPSPYWPDGRPNSSSSSSSAA